MSATQLYDDCGGHLVLDLVNSIGRTPEGTRNERLVDYATLIEWCVLAGCFSAHQGRSLVRLARGRPRVARAVLERVRVLREALFRTFTAELEGSRPARADLEAINAEIGRAFANACVERTAEGYGWSWAGTATALDAPLWPLARAAGELLVSPDRALVKECAGERCLWLFLDRTRNHARRWCDMKVCGNRAKVREHRRRQGSKRR